MNTINISSNVLFIFTLISAFYWIEILMDLDYQSRPQPFVSFCWLLRVAECNGQTSDLGNDLVQGGSALCLPINFSARLLFRQYLTDPYNRYHYMYEESVCFSTHLREDNWLHDQNHYRRTCLISFSSGSIRKWRSFVPSFLGSAEPEDTKS